MSLASKKLRITCEGVPQPDETILTPKRRTLDRSIRPWPGDQVPPIERCYLCCVITRSRRRARAICIGWQRLPLAVVRPATVHRVSGGLDGTDALASHETGKRGVQHSPSLNGCFEGGHRMSVLMLSSTSINASLVTRNCLSSKKLDWRSVCSAVRAFYLKAGYLASARWRPRAAFW